MILFFFCSILLVRNNTSDLSKKEINKMTTYYFDMDGVLANFHKNFDYKKRVQQAMNRQWIANLEPFLNNVAIVKDLIAQGNRVYILTAAANEAAKLGKIDWLSQWIPELNIADSFICIVGHGRKVDYIKEEGILIDDDTKNTKAWIKEGHKAIYLETKGMTIQF